MALSRRIVPLISISLAASAVVVPTGGLLSITVMDSTALDPISSIGPSGSGWVAKCVLKGLTSLVGTVDPTKLSLTVLDPGYDTSGNTTTVTRTITGVAHLRRQYPNGASKQISTDATDLTFYVSLDDWVYASSTISAASISSGFYPSSVSSDAGTITNSSTIAYQKPLFGWLHAQNDSVGSSAAVEAVAFHRHAKNGQQVAAIKYYATDGTHTSADVLVSAPALSARVTQGNIPEVWKGTVDTSTMTDGAVATVIAKVYPWLGDSSAVLNLSTDGLAWPTSLPSTPLRVFVDSSGGYGGAYAYVDGTGGGTPQVSTTAATAKAHPYSTVDAAATAIKTFNNANKGHNNLGGGIIRLMDDGSGGPKTHTKAADIVNSPGSTWLTIEKDPATAATVTLTFNGTQHTPTLTKFRNLTLLAGTATFTINGNAEARSSLALEGCTFDNTANKTAAAQLSTVYLLNTTVTGNNCNFLSNITDGNLALAAGVVGSTTVSVNNPAKLMVGCSMPKYSHTVDATTGGDGSDGSIIYNNKMLGLRFNSTDRAAAIVTATPSPTYSNGVAVVQNLMENDLSNGTSTLHLFADSDLTVISNIIEFCNTGVGERCSHAYNDVVACDVVPNGIVKTGASRYNVWDNYNLKSDTFSSGAGSPGNWAYGYSVGNRGNVCLFGNVQRQATDAPHNDNTDAPYLGNAWLSSSEYNLFRTALGFTQAQIMAMFTSYTVKPQAVAALGGNYQPINSASNLKSRVPTGSGVLVYDIAGNTRKTDGTGAAGCYEAAP